MVSDNEQMASPRRDYGGFVPAVFARSAEDAEKYRVLLDDHDIPAFVGDEGVPDRNKAQEASPPASITRGVPVMVPEPLLDEASEVIADFEDLDDFELEEDVEEETDDEFGMGVEVDPDSDDLLDDEEDEDDEEDDDYVDEEDDDFLEDDEPGKGGTH